MHSATMKYIRFLIALNEFCQEEGPSNKTDSKTTR